ncbi:flotillin [Tessaracoccus lapidicaptus]|uniref:Flotillin n=1 Tax=Tessaracoccus lapidicaptus TaxID=1427523 RepID=A0A1C0APR8_9ACTN|nr:MULTISPECIES: flotillin family protein [Tessaracoccus]AQX15310.1 flotillin [Tessaracoccus sp. T2.5-30]OCL36369.1 flotillin [Tessaracoccus lapidicaptus]VEP39584.1 Inner membrane protein YqiK [Tessaracoccus lapidicaptus]
MPPAVLAVGGLLLLLLLVGLLIASRYKVAKPNEAFIITGRKGKEVRNPETGLVSTDLSGQKVVMGGGVFVVPFIQRLHVLDLSSRRIMVTIRNAVSGQGIKLNVDGVAIVKVGGNEDSIRAAAQRFLSQQGEIETFTQETLAGSLRSIVGSLTVEQIIRDRAAFAQRVTDESESSLTGQGLVLDTFQIQDITDDGSYLSDLGRPESAKLGRMAAVAEAEARREAEQAQIAAEQEIAIANRALVLKQAEIQAETDAARAQAAAAGPLAQADRDQAILLEQEKVAVAQAALKERQLDTEVRRPADAERYRVETAAEAQRNAAIFEAEARKAASIANAEAEAEKARLTGVGEKSRRTAEAEAVRAEGEAKAAAVLAVGQAEAEAMDKRAEAFAHYNDAAVLQMLIEVLPQIAEKVAAPMAGIDTLTVVSTEGASALPKTVTTNMLQTLQMVKDTTGYDLTAALDRFASRDRASAE